MKTHVPLGILAAVGAAALSVAAQQPAKTPYKPPLGQRTVQGVWNGFEYVTEGDWIPDFIWKKGPGIDDPSNYEKPGDYRGESRPGYRAQPTPQSVAFYRYIMNKAAQGQEINMVESAAIRRMIANRTWPEAPEVTDAHRSAKGWADRQKEDASILTDPVGWTRGKNADIIYKELTAGGVTEEDTPPTEGSEKFRQYWYSLTPEERKNLPLAGWMKNYLVNKGFDMRSDEERANDEAYKTEQERRAAEAEAAKSEAERNRAEEAKRDAERQENWFKDKWAEEDKRIAAEDAKNRLEEAVRKSKEEGAGPTETESTPGAGGTDGEMKDGRGQPVQPEGGGAQDGGVQGPKDDKNQGPSGEGDRDSGGRHKPGTGGEAVKGPDQEPGGTERGEAGETENASPGASGMSDPSTGGKDGGQAANDVRNDAGDKVDAGRYGNGDMVVDKSGTEYANQGGQWVKTGNNYGPYKPEGGLGDEPKAGQAEGGDKASGDERGTGLNGFTESRNGRTDANTRDSFGLMAGQQNINQASTRGDAAERDAKNLVNSAGRDAQDTLDKSAGQTAAGDRANSWGTAIGNGIQQGVEKGVTAAGEAFGKGAADEASKSIFGGPKDDGKDPGAGAEGGQGAATVAGGSAGQQASGGGGQSSGGSRGGAHGAGHGDGHGGGGTKVATRPPPKTIPTRGGGAGHHAGGGSEGGYSTGASPGSSPGATSGGSAGTGGGSGSPPPPPTYTITCPACHRSFTVDTPGGHMCPFCVTMNCPKCGYSAVYDRGAEPAGCPSCAAKAAAAAAAAAAAGAK